jgi:inorganic pyrophosphatase
MFLVSFAIRLYLVNKRIIMSNMSFMNELDVGENLPHEFNVLIEIPKGSNVKYEIDEKTGALFVDRKLFTSMNYPFNYGFIPKTREDDGDPIDVLVLGDDAFVPKSVISTRPVGILLTEDEEGKDSKIIAVPLRKIDPALSYIVDLDSVPQHIRAQIKHFFEHYKELEEGKYVRVTGWGNSEEAKKKIMLGIENYSKLQRNVELFNNGQDQDHSS